MRSRSFRSLPDGLVALRELDVRSSRISTIPLYLDKLRVLDVSGCQQLAVAWLPDSSTTCIGKLSMVATKLTVVPEGIIALRELNGSWMGAGCERVQTVCGRSAASKRRHKHREAGHEEHPCYRTGGYDRAAESQLCAMRKIKIAFLFVDPLWCSGSWWQSDSLCKYDQVLCTGLARHLIVSRLIFCSRIYGLMLRRSGGHFV